MDAADLADAIGNSVNSGIDVDEFKDGIDSEHNTLQREAYRQVFKPGMKALAGTEYVDFRNEREVELAREVCDKMGWTY
jgi:hypothetical protein